MASSLLFFALLQTARFDWPDPYVALGASVFENKFYKLNDEGVVTYDRMRKKYFLFGFPFRVALDEFKDFSMALIPEFGWSPTHYQFNLMLGAEGEWAKTHRYNPTAFVWQTHGGFHFAKLTSPGDPIKEDGSALSGSDQESIALVFGVSVGPKFYIAENLYFRFLVNPRILYGKIAPRMYQYDKWDNVGFNLNLIFQIEFSGWARNRFPKLLKTSEGPS